MTRQTSTGIESLRAHETRVALDASLEEVWKAITDAQALSRWFAPKMTVAPGSGGFVLADWGPGLEWKCLIEVWEPNRHLRLVETRDRLLSASPVTQPLEPCRLVEDFYLETAQGGTVLRLVHSGFGSSAEWDVEYEGTRGGWPGCFLRLKHGLERHRNESTRNIILTAIDHGADRRQTLRRIESAAPRPLELALRGAYEFCGVLPEMNGSIVTASAQPSPAGTVAYLELLLFGYNDADADAVENRLRETLRREFPAPLPAVTAR